MASLFKLERVNFVSEYYRVYDKQGNRVGTIGVADKAFYVEDNDNFVLDSRYYNEDKLDDEFLTIGCELLKNHLYASPDKLYEVTYGNPLTITR